MGEPSPLTQTSEKPAGQRLDSWKEIAAYLDRDVTTVQRWEKREGMPVHRHVHDKRGSVYALSSELDAWRQSRKLPLDEEESQSQPEPPINVERDSTRTAPRQVRRWFTVATVAAIGLLTIAYFIYRRGTSDASRPKINSLAVLPLKNLSGDPAQQYLADGMTEALIGRLSSIHDLRVISHTSVMRFNNPQISVPEIAKMLRVDAIVEGSVMRDGNRIRVTVQLIRGATDEHFWSETYDREFKDVLSLQSELAQSIAEKVEVTVTGEEHERLTAARSVAPEVYENYLKGRFAYNRGNSRANIEESIGDFQSAINEDPTFAPAYLGLASSYSRLSTVFIGAAPDETRPKILSAAGKALELDPSLAEAHVLLADVQQKQWHWADAEAEYRRALELNPNDADAHAGLASWLLSQGRADEAVAWAQRGRELDPLAVSGVSIGWIQFHARHYDQAEHELRSVLAVQPDDANALWYLGFVLLAENRAKDAIPPLEKALSLSNRSPGVIGILIRAYAQAGRRGDALVLLSELKRRGASGYIPAGAFVNAYLGLGENDQALIWLEQAYKEQSNVMLYLKVHPYFDPIRHDPRFVDLVHRVGLG